MTLPSAEMAGEWPPNFTCWPATLTLIRKVWPVRRSRRKMSSMWLVSPGTRLLEVAAKDTYRASAEMAGSVQPPRQPPSPSGMQFASPPVDVMLTRSVRPEVRSWTKMSLTRLVSPPTRSLARDWNTTYRPSDEIVGKSLAPLASRPAESTLSRSVVPVSMSWTKTSHAWFMSFGTRVVAPELNVTYRPSAESREKSPLTLSPCTPLEDTLTRVVEPVCMS